MLVYLENENYCAKCDNCGYKIDFKTNSWDAALKFAKNKGFKITDQNYYKAANCLCKNCRKEKMKIKFKGIELEEGTFTRKDYGYYFSLYDTNGNEIYYECSDGDWTKFEYDKNGNEIYYEDSDGYWYKKEYDENGNETYWKNSDGFWTKYEYDKNGKLIKEKRGKNEN